MRSKVIRRVGWPTFAVLALLLTTAALVTRPWRALRVVAGLGAHNVCSAVFVAGLDPANTSRELVGALVGSTVEKWITYHVDRSAARVDTSFAGVHARAQFTPGYGCRLDYAQNVPPPPARAAFPQAIADDFAPLQPVASTDAVISQALDRVFVETKGATLKHVKAVVVVKSGRVIAERYAPGFGIGTPLLSYSVAKSFTNALLAVLVRKGLVHVDQTGVVPEWSASGDPRARITIENLLRMDSGLDAAEAESPFSVAAQMEYTVADMARFAAQHPLKEPPSTRWEYTSANTLILDRFLGGIVGGGAAGMRDFAEHELFAPLKMTDVTMEFDGAGVFIGSSYVYAPARSYARLGMLFLNDGIGPNGQRLLPEGWVAWSRRSTLGAPYGAGFWTNDGPSDRAARRIASGFPVDGFYASGDLGQRIYIVPSEQLVIARFGYSLPPSYGIVDDLALIDAAIRATR